MPDGGEGSVRLVINARTIDARKAIQDELERAKLRLQELAKTDGLTGLANRRRLDETLALELRRSQREGNPLALMVLDIDHFKRLNDSHGHPAGDAVPPHGSILTTFPNRAGDLAARSGGKEFGLILPAENYQQALAIDFLITDVAGVTPARLRVHGRSPPPDQSNTARFFRAADCPESTAAPLDRQSVPA